MNVSPNTSLSPLLRHLDTVPPGQAQLFVCHEILEQLAAIELSPLEKEAYCGNKLVTQTFTPLPPLETIIDQTLTALAEVALAVWPHWYGQTARPEAQNTAALSYPNLELSRELPELSTPTHRRISRPWFRTTTYLCQESKTPLCRRFPLALQVQQLALALSPQELTIILASEESKPGNQRLFGLARAAQWYAKETNARVMVLIPPSTAIPKELEVLFYGGTIASTLHSHRPSAPVPEAKLRYWPVEGTPHPFSPGEQLLAQQLEADQELASLFEFNQRVSTVRNTHYLVDLLWRTGKLIVEVDGFRVHTRQAAFYHDRHRDYELLLSGYISSASPIRKCSPLATGLWRKFAM